MSKNKPNIKVKIALIELKIEFHHRKVTTEHVFLILQVECKYSVRDQIILKK